MIWILFSDSLLSLVSKDSLLWQLAHVHMLKGVFFIGVTGAALFYFVHSLQQKLIAKEKDVANLFDYNPHPLIALDSSSLKVVQANEAAIALLDLHSHQLIQRDFCEILIEEERNRFKEDLANKRQTSRFRTAGVWCLESRTGELLSIRIDVVHLIDQDGDTIILALNNLTPQLSAEKELKQFAQFTEQKIAQRTSHLQRRNEELVLRANETEKVNAELIFINERLQLISRQQSTAENNI